MPRGKTLLIEEEKIGKPFVIDQIRLNYSYLMAFVGSAVDIKKCMKHKLLHILVTEMVNEPVGTINLSIIIII